MSKGYTLLTIPHISCMGASKSEINQTLWLQVSSELILVVLLNSINPYGAKVGLSSRVSDTGIFIFYNLQMVKGFPWIIRSFHPPIK